jgi:hypothetical protein
MSSIYIKSRRWKYDDLDGKLVEFRIAYPDSHWVDGIGEFRLHGNGVDLLAIDIVVDHPKEFFENQYHLCDSLVEKIEVHPDPKVAQYRCVGVFDPKS